MIAFCEFNTYPVVATVVETLDAAGVGAVGLPVNAGDAKYVAWFAGVNPRAVVTSALVKVTRPVRELNDATPFVLIAFTTNAVVAIFVELSEVAGVGAAGLPVNVGDAKVAYVEAFAAV